MKKNVLYKCSDCGHEFSQPADAFDAESDLYPGCPSCGSTEFSETRQKEGENDSFLNHEGKKLPATFD